METTERTFSANATAHGLAAQSVVAPTSGHTLVFVEAVSVEKPEKFIDAIQKVSTKDGVLFNFSDWQGFPVIFCTRATL